MSKLNLQELIENEIKKVLEGNIKEATKEIDFNEPKRKSIYRYN